MKKTIKVIKTLIKLNIEKNLIYTFNSFFILLASMIYIFTFLLSIRYVFNHVQNIRGFTYDQLFILVCMSQAWWYTNVFIARKSFESITQSINNGFLDFFLSKPVKLRLIIPFLSFDFRHSAPLLISILLIIIKVIPLNLSFIQIVIGLLLFLNGILITYSITSIFTCMNFWVGRNTAIFDITWEMPDLIKLPLAFFPGILKFIFTYIIPVTVMINPTFQVIHNDINYPLVISAIVMNIVLFILSEYIWRLGLKCYSSAS